MSALRSSAILAVLCAAAVSCSGPEAGPPTCNSALHNVYSQGCYMVESDGTPLGVTAAVADCEATSEDARTWGCTPQMESLVDCYARMDDGICGSCNDVIMSVAVCLEDAQMQVCPGYLGDLIGCCVVTDPCGWADDGYCECDGACDWDGPDCEREQLCEDCIASQCGSDLEACLADSHCTMLVQCYALCSDDSCIDQCEVDHADGLALYAPLAACLLDSCSEWCG